MTRIDNYLEFTYDSEVDSPNSSFAPWAGYDAVEKKMLIRTGRGDYILYSEVPPEYWDAYANAESKGRAYRDYIKGKFTYEGTGEDHPVYLSLTKREPDDVIISGGTFSVGGVSLSSDGVTYGNADNNVALKPTGTYMVTAEFKSFEEAVKWASYLDGNAEYLSLSRVKEEE